MFSSLKFKLLLMSSLLYFIAYKREYKNISHYKSSQNKTAIQVSVMASANCPFNDHLLLSHACYLPNTCLQP